MQILTTRVDQCNGFIVPVMEHNVTICQRWETPPWYCIVADPGNEESSSDSSTQKVILHLGRMGLGGEPSIAITLTLSMTKEQKIGLLTSKAPLPLPR